jgi:hypothetical protein
MIRSNFRQRVSAYLMDVEALAAMLRDTMPLLLESADLGPEDRRAPMRLLLDRLDRLLVRVENKSNEEDRS